MVHEQRRGEDVNSVSQYLSGWIRQIQNNVIRWYRINCFVKTVRLRKRFSIIGKRILFCFVGCLISITKNNLHETNYWFSMINLFVPEGLNFSINWLFNFCLINCILKTYLRKLEKYYTFRYKTSKNRNLSRRCENVKN